MPSLKNFKMEVCSKGHKAYFIEYKGKNGRLYRGCPQCKRHKAGICLECPAPTISKRHKRCTKCQKARRLEVRKTKHRKAQLAAQRKYRRKPDIKIKHKLDQREYRKQEKLKLIRAILPLRVAS
jgi:hypothetical protein